jgi:hypothetical protein
VGVLDVGIPRTPAQARAALAAINAPNPQAFEQIKKDVERRIAELTGPVVQGAQDSLAAMNDELAELIQAATGHDEALEALRRKITRREITAKDARKERDRIRREEMKLSQLLDSITAAHEREFYVRDHPEDVLNVLYDRYPALPGRSSRSDPDSGRAGAACRFHGPCCTGSSHQSPTRGGKPHGNSNATATRPGSGRFDASRTHPIAVALRSRSRPRARIPQRHPPDREAVLPEDGLRRYAARSPAVGIALCDLRARLVERSGTLRVAAVGGPGSLGRPQQPRCCCAAGAATLSGTAPVTAAKASDVPSRVQQVLDALPDAHPSGDGWAARCPAHGDGSPSLVVSVGEDGYQPVVWCHGGCDYADVRAAFISRGVPETALRPAGPGQRPSTAAQRPPNRRTARPPDTAKSPLPPPTDEQVWRWTAVAQAAGRLARLAKERRGFGRDVLAQAEIGWDDECEAYTLPVHDLTTGEVVDLRMGRPGPKGRIAWRHRTGGTARLFSPTGLGDGPVLLCEREWDVLMARQRGFNAVGTTGGAGTVPAVELLEPLRGRAVFVAFDCDGAGRTGAEKWATRLAGLGCAVHVVDLGLPDKGADVSDWFAKYGRGAGDLRELMDATPEWSGEPEVLPDPDRDDVLALVRAEFLADREDGLDHLADLVDDEGLAALPPVEWVVDR